MLKFEDPCIYYWKTLSGYCLEISVLRLGLQNSPKFPAVPQPTVPAVQAYTVVAAPAGFCVGGLGHLCCTISLDVAHAAQAAIMENPGADPAWEEALSCPDLTDITHLIVDNLAKRINREYIHSSVGGKILWPPNTELPTWG